MFCRSKEVSFSEKSFELKKIKNKMLYSIYLNILFSNREGLHMLSFGSGLSSYIGFFIPLIFYGFVFYTSIKVLDFLKKQEQIDREIKQHLLEIKSQLEEIKDTIKR
jgi:hypothetical protein